MKSFKEEVVGQVSLAAAGCQEHIKLALANLCFRVRLEVGTVYRIWALEFGVVASGGLRLWALS